MNVNGQLCFVLMPFGSKPDSTGALIDFDAVYADWQGLISESFAWDSPGTRIPSAVKALLST